jgi:hypothetical protein
MSVTCDSAETCIHTGLARKRCRERRIYNANKEEERLASRMRSRSRKRLLEIEPTMTCVGLAELPDHVCSGKAECHHRDGDYTNIADANLAWACRAAHELLDMQVENANKT